jgi:hypothetical protein
MEKQESEMEDEVKVVRKTDETIETTVRTLDELKELEDQRRERLEIEADNRRRAEARRAG